MGSHLIATRRRTTSSNNKADFGCGKPQWATMATRVCMCAFVMLALGIVSAQAMSQSRTVFAGVPAIKIQEAGLGRAPLELERAEAVKWACVISEIGGKFYWASRENRELTRQTSGSFITYVAVDGSGYVRVIGPDAKQRAASMSATEAEFDYVEHLLIGLQSVTYYGHTR
jgi:hypothetical protein